MRAEGLWREALERYEPPPLDDAVREELLEFVARRTRELGDEPLELGIPPEAPTRRRGLTQDGQNSQPRWRRPPRSPRAGAASETTARRR